MQCCASSLKLPQYVQSSTVRIGGSFKFLTFEIYPNLPSVQTERYNFHRYRSIKKHGVIDPYRTEYREIDKEKKKERRRLVERIAIVRAASRAALLSSPSLPLSPFHYPYNLQIFWGTRRKVARLNRVPETEEQSFRQGEKGKAVRMVVDRGTKRRRQRERERERNRGKVGGGLAA